MNRARPIQTAAFTPSSPLIPPNSPLGSQLACATFCRAEVQLQGTNGGERPQRAHCHRVFPRIGRWAEAVRLDTTLNYLTYNTSKVPIVRIAGSGIVLQGTQYVPHQLQ
jgi:hypothetical protein